MSRAGSARQGRAVTHRPACRRAPARQNCSRSGRCLCGAGTRQRLGPTAAGPVPGPRDTRRRSPRHEHDGGAARACGRPHLYGGTGADTINSGNNNDLIYAGTGNDVVDGGNGDDTLYGGDGDDVMGGGNGDDYLYGEAGNDTNYGETLLGSLLYLFDNGDDHIYGGPGNDDLVLPFLLRRSAAGGGVSGVCGAGVGAQSAVGGVAAGAVLDVDVVVAEGRAFAPATSRGVLRIRPIVRIRAPFRDLARRAALGLAWLRTTAGRVTTRCWCWARSTHCSAWPHACTPAATWPAPTRCFPTSTTRRDRLLPRTCPARHPGRSPGEDRRRQAGDRGVLPGREERMRPRPVRGPSLHRLGTTCHLANQGPGTPRPPSGRPQR